jgi:hypothetical protein
LIKGDNKMIRFVIKCVKSNSSLFAVGGYYAVNEEGVILSTNNGKEYGTKHSASTYAIWYCDCNWTTLDFELVIEYTFKPMCPVWKKLDINEYNSYYTSKIEETYNLVKTLIDVNGKTPFKELYDALRNYDDEEVCTIIKMLVE